MQQMHSGVAPLGPIATSRPLLVACGPLGQIATSRLPCEATSQKQKQGRPADSLCDQPSSSGQLARNCEVSCILWHRPLLLRLLVNDDDDVDMDAGAVFVVLVGFECL